MLIFYAPGLQGIVFEQMSFIFNFNSHQKINIFQTEHIRSDALILSCNESILFLLNNPHIDEFECIPEIHQYCSSTVNYRTEVTSIINLMIDCHHEDD